MDSNKVTVKTAREQGERFYQAIEESCIALRKLKISEVDSIMTFLMTVGGICYSERLLSPDGTSNAQRATLGMMGRVMAAKNKSEALEIVRKSKPYIESMFEVDEEALKAAQESPEVQNLIQVVKHL